MIEAMLNYQQFSLRSLETSWKPKDINRYYSKVLTFISNLVCEMKMFNTWSLLKRKKINLFFRL